MSDLYPRQRAGFWTLLIVGLLTIGAILAGVPAQSVLLGVFLMGVGVGMLAGNTRTKRVPGNRRW